MNDASSSNTRRVVIGGVLLAAAYWISPMLFWIVTGVYVAVVLARSKQQNDDDEESEEVDRAYDLLLSVREDAFLRGNSVILSEGPWLIQLRERTDLTTGGHPQLETICPICPPIPFCFILKPRRPLQNTGKLVINTPVDASFEYELKAFELPEALGSRFECGTNAKGLFEQCLQQGLLHMIEEATHHHSIHLQEIIFDGSRVRVSALPAQDLTQSTKEAEHLTERTRLFADQLKDFIAKNELVEAVRRKS